MFVIIENSKLKGCERENSIYFRMSRADKKTDLCRSCGDGIQNIHLKVLSVWKRFIYYFDWFM